MIHPAYLAGLIDGEGSIIIARQRGASTRKGYHYIVQVKISNNCRQVLDEIKAELGGNIHLNTNRPMQMKVLHDNWQYTVVAKQAGRVLHAIAPFLKIKNLQCEMALDLISRTHYRGLPLSADEWDYRDSLYHRMRELNSRYDGRVQMIRT